MLSTEHIQNKLKQLRLVTLSNELPKLLERAEENDMSYLQFAQQFCDLELGSRNSKRIEANRCKAGFPVIKSLEEFDYTVQPSITKKQINQLLDFAFIDDRQNLIFIGPPGVGKTHLSIGIGLKAIQRGYKVLFKKAMELAELMEVAELRGELKSKLHQLAKYDLLIIDELGYLPINKQSNHNFFQLINTMYEHRSIILTTNKEFTQWGDFFADGNISVPIVDRLIHHSRIFILGGESYRLKHKINEGMPIKVGQN